MVNVFKALKEFHTAFRVPILFRPAVPLPERQLLRKKLIEEELKEVIEALDSQDLVSIANELADLIYVTVGTALEYGIPLDKIFAEVHRSNMTKLDEDGYPILREDGKILKPTTFTPPALEPILEGGNTLHFGEGNEGVLELLSEVESKGWVWTGRKAPDNCYYWSFSHASFGRTLGWSETSLFEAIQLAAKRTREKENNTEKEKE